MSVRNPTVLGDTARFERGLLLTLLAEAFPKARTEVSLKAEVSGVGFDVSDELWRSNLAYLEASAYIERHTATLRARVLHSWRITPRGLNLVDGNLPADAGVDLTTE